MTACQSHLILCLSLLLCATSTADIVLSEVVAENGPLGFTAADGSAYDWIELHNNGPSAVDLRDSYLTDDPAFRTKWRFLRSFVIPPGGFRVVFASDRNGLFDNEEHTNFKLNATGGEYLALIASDGVSVLSEFAPTFPPLPQYVAYGRILGGNTLGKLTTPTPNAANSGAAPEPKVLSFTASVAALPSGADVTLTWATENTESVELAQSIAPSPGFTLIGNVAASGSTVRNPTLNTTYRLRALNAYGTHEATIEIGVGPNVLTLEAFPTTIASGGSTVMRWSTAGTDATLTLNGIAVEPANGRRILPLAGAAAADSVVPVTLTAANASGTVSKTVDVIVLAENAPLPPLPPVVISEFYWSYQGTFPYEPYRFFELHNREFLPLDLDGMQLAGSKSFRFSNAAPRILAPDGYALVVADPAAFVATWPGDRPVIGVFENLGVDDEYVWELDQFLLDAYGRVIEHITGDQPLPDAGIFHPAQRIDEAAAPDFPGNWKVIEGNENGFGGGTPGEPTFEILALSLDPPTASPGDTVTIAWETTRSVPMALSNGIGPVSGPSGSVPFTVPLDATEAQFTLTAQTSFATFSRTISLTLPPAIRSFWSTESAISRGDNVTLHWNLKSGNTLTFRVDPEIGIAGTPLTFTPLIQGFPVRNLWRYLPNGNGQGPAWRDPGFDDRNWRFGLGIFGYGNDIEDTVIERGEWVTAYFRRHFHVDEVDQVESLSVDLLIDDGAEVYLNGTEVLRELLPPGVIDFNTQASGVSPNDGREHRPFALDPAALIEGDNVIAVGAHNNISNAADFGFDLGLSAVKTIPPDGRKNYTLTASNPAGTASATVTILFEEKTPLSDWMLANSLVGDPATNDTDLDGLADLMEFATGTDPRAASPPPLTLEIDDDGRLRVRFPHHLSRDNVLLGAETSADLESWRPLEDDFVFESRVAPPGSSVAESIHRSYAPARETRYIRLVASQLP